jgi:metal-responsive CopG/Arc/MetJ family transcriptional regulator
VVGLKVVATKLPDDEYQALVERVKIEGISMSEFVRNAIRSYLGLTSQSSGYAMLAELRRRLVNLEKRVLDLEIAVAELHLELEAKHQGER